MRHLNIRNVFLSRVILLLRFSHDIFFFCLAFLLKSSNFVTVMGKNLLFNTSSELISIPSDAVVYITADRNYSTISVADGGQYMLTMQLGQIEHRISEMIDVSDNRFVRIGKSLIVNRNYITFINHARQKLILSDCHTFRTEVSASREALKALKDLIEKEAEK